MNLVVRAMPTQMPTTPEGLLFYVVDKIYPCLRQLRELYNVFAQGMNDGSFDIGGVTVRVVTGVPADTDPDGSIAFRIDGTAGSVKRLGDGVSQQSVRGALGRRLGRPWQNGSSSERPDPSSGR